MPFTPEPLDLRETFEHLALRIAAYEQKGHFTNANMERIPMSELAFGVVPASEARRVRKKIRAFAKANGWAAVIHDPGISVIFKKITPSGP